MVITILIFFCLLLVLVLAHECGHFVVARMHGMKVEEFGFGFPPRIFSIRRGDTTYSFNWIPLGGFVRIKGENGGESNEPDSFAAQRPWRRATVLVAGVAMNVLVAIVLFSFTFGVGVPTILDDALPQGAHISHEQLQIVGLFKNGPADKGGLRVGDSVTRVDALPVATTEAVRKAVASGVPVTVYFLRDHLEQSLTITPAPLEQGGQPLLGVQLARTGVVRYPWYRAVYQGTLHTAYTARDIVRAFGKVLYELFVKRHIAEDLAGPIGIALITGEVIHMGWLYVLQFAGLLSLNLAIINVVPFPALDGGRLLFVIIEKIRKKPMRAHTEAMIHNVGFALLIVLVIIITYKDITRLGGDAL